MDRIAAVEKALNRLIGEVRGMSARQARSEQMLMRLVGETTEEIGAIMATKETLARMNASVLANTDVVKAASEALTHFAQTNADLTKQLQEALANDDEPAVKAAADALEKNNADLLATVPTTASNILANTPSA